MKPIVEQLPFYITLLLLFVAAVVDLCTDKIPNGWIVLGLACAIILGCQNLLLAGWIGFVTGPLLVLALFWIPFRMGALGAGDIKLFLVLGCIHGANAILSIILLSFLLAAGISLGKLLYLKHLRSSLRTVTLYFRDLLQTNTLAPYPGRQTNGHTIHFSVAIFGGYVLWLGGNTCKEIILYLAG